MFIGYSAGGGYDTYGRIVARYMGKHIPGSPNMVPKNLPGAGSLLLVNQLYNTLPKDGTAVGIFARAAAWEPLFDAAKIDDELGAFVLRLGAGMAAMGPNPKQAGGYYVFVANGSLQKDGQALPLWSMVVVESNEDGFEIRAGDKGLEALILQYPIENN